MANNFIIVTDDRETTGKITKWATVAKNNIIGFRDILQFILDSCNKPEVYYIVDETTQNVYSLLDVATKQYEMRKRTFEERMTGTQTGKWSKYDF